MKIRKEVKVGLFALLMMVALYLMFNFFKGKDLIGQNTHYYALYDNVTGLQVSSPVDIRGMKVGVVSEIMLDPKTNKVCVGMEIGKQYNIPQDTKARMYSGSLMGNKSIALDMGNSDKIVPRNGTIESVVAPDLVETLGSKVSQLADDFSVTLSKVNEAVDGVNEMLAQNSASVNGVVRNVDAITANINSLLENKSGEIESIVDGLNSLSANIKNNSAQIDSIISDVSSMADSLRSADISGVVNNLSTTLSELHVMLAAVNNGDGSISKAISNPDLYNSLVSSVDNLSSLLADIKANPKKYINVTVFGGKDKSKTK